MTPLDMSIINHECAHALVAILEGWKLALVRADRYSADMLDCFGKVSYLTEEDASPESQARVYLAGNVLEPSRPSSFDIEKALRVWASIGAPRGWLEQREREIDEILTRERHALNALCDELVEADLVLVGTRAERVVAETRTSPVRVG